MSDTEKFPVKILETLQREFDALPKCPIEELTRPQIMRALMPQVKAMRAKGYGLPAIVKMISDRGVRVTEASLASYLKEARRSSKRKRGVASKKATQKVEARVPPKATETNGRTREIVESESSLTPLPTPGGVQGNRPAP